MYMRFMLTEARLVISRYVYAIATRCIVCNRRSEVSLSLYWLVDVCGGAFHVKSDSQSPRSDCRSLWTKLAAQSAEALLHS